MNLGRDVTGRLTDDHDGELDTLPDLVSSSLSGCERHFWFFALLVVERRGRERVVGVSLSWSTTFEAKADRRVWKATFKLRRHTSTLPSFQPQPRPSRLSLLNAWSLAS